MKNNILKNTIKHISLKIVVTHVFLLLVGVLLGYYFSNTSASSSSSELRLGGKSGFTNPLLECEVAQNTISSRNADFKPELDSFVDKLKKKDNLATISVYYRDLNNGPVIGIDSSETFAPASLLKVPVLIAYLKWSEDKPSVLDENIKYEKYVDVGYTQKFAPSVELVIGNTYTARELLENMTRYSDNQALVLLYQRLPKSYQDELYTLLGIDPDIVTSGTGTLTIRQYSIFFRILFNASFLSRSNSEYALRLLSESTFERGIKKASPEDIVVSNKFGERKTENSLQQFHECGIVYYPDHPYLLCVMTRGEDVNALIDGIYETAGFVYNQVKEQHKKNL